MVAVVPPLLSDRPPEIPQKAGLGDRFHYFRGRSGRRYLFTLVPGETLADFRNVVAMRAEPAPAGRLSARAVVTLDARGDWSWPSAGERHALCLVHLLAATEAERRAVIDDLTSAATMQLAA